MLKRGKMNGVFDQGEEKVCVVAGRPESGNHGFRRSSVIRPAIIACAEKGRLSLSARAHALSLRCTVTPRACAPVRHRR